MKKKRFEITEFSKAGGNSTKIKHGSEHYSRIAAKGRETVRKNDPDYFKRLALLGRHARQVKIQTEIAKQLGEKLHPTAFDNLGKLISGKS